MAVSLAFVNPLMPIIAFLFIFILVYALLVKTKVLDMSPWATVFFSIIIASFFIVNVSLVEFAKLSVSWIVVFLIVIVFFFLIMGFMGKDALELVTSSKGSWFKAFAGVIVLIFVLIFVFSSSYVFNWAVNWDLIESWFTKDWFGMVLLLIVAGIVSVVLTKKVADKKS